MRSSSRALAALAILGGAAACGGSADQPAIVTGVEGTVRDATTQAVLQGASVSTEPPSSVITTGADGRFRFEALTPATSYRVRATLAGYAAGEATITTTEGEVKSVDLALASQAPRLELSRDVLDFGDTSSVESLVIRNVGAEGSLLPFRITATAPWIAAIEPAEAMVGATPVSVEVRVDRAVLGTMYGRKDTTLDLVAAGASRTIAVRLDHVAPDAPILGLTPESLDFATATTTRTIELRNLGRGALVWSLELGASWLAADSRTGTIAAGQRQTVTLTASRAGLPEGASTAALTFRSNDADRPTRTVPVSITVAGTPVLEVSTRSLDFGTAEDRLGLTVSNTGGGALRWSASVGGADWLTVTPTAGAGLGRGASSTLTVVIDRGRIPPGVATTDLRLTSNANAVAVTVRAEVVAAPRLEVTPNPLALGLAESAELVVRNAGLSDLDWTVTATSPWIAIDTTSGRLSSSFGLPSAETRLRITVDRANRGAGTVRGGLDFVSNGGSVRVPISMLVPSVRWQRATPSRQPSARRGAALVWDRAANVAVLFGGRDATQAYAETWIFDGSDWIQDGRSPRPPARAGAAMVWDSVSRRLVLYGGDHGGGDTWVRDAGGWREIVTSGPAARRRVGLHWDGQVVYALGGLDMAGNPVGAVSTFDGTGWTALPLAVPTIVDASPLGIDANTLSILAVPCAGASCSGLAVYQSTRTTPPVLVAQLAASLERSGHVAFARGVAHYLWGGEGAGGLLAELLQVNPAGGATPVPVVGGPSARREASVAYDRTTDRAVVFGGQTATGLSSETWILSF